MEVETYNLLVVVSVDRGVSSNDAVGDVDIVVDAVVVDGGDVVVTTSELISGLMVGSRNS